MRHVPSGGQAIAGPLLDAGLVHLLRDTQVASLTGHRLFRTVLAHLGVRTGADLGRVTADDMLLRLGDDHDLLRAFRDQARAYAKRLIARMDREDRPGPRAGMRERAEHEGRVAVPASVSERAAAEALAAEARRLAGEGRRLAEENSRRREAEARAVEALRLAEEDRRRAQEDSRRRDAKAHAAREAARATARNAEFRAHPLAGTVRRSLSLLSERNAALVARKLGLAGEPATDEALAAEFGIHRSRVPQLLRKSIARLERLDGWPGRLRLHALTMLPLSAAEFAGSPWLDGLDVRCLAVLVRVGTGKRAYAVRSVDGPVLGFVKPDAWRDMCISAKRLVISSDGGVEPAAFLDDLRACMPAGAAGYERFLLREIGWSADPGPDWLLAIKARICVADVIRQVAGQAEGPLGAKDLMARVSRHASLKNDKSMRSAVYRVARHLPDGRWETRRKHHLDRDSVKPVAEACERLVAARPGEAPLLRAADLAATAAEDASLAGIRVDADLVEAAVRASSGLVYRGLGRIGCAEPDDGFTEAGPPPAP